MSKTNRLRLLAVCCIFYLLAIGVSVPVQAQHRLDSLQHLEEVVVTGRSLQKEIIPVQQLAGEQLQRLGSHNVADALRYFSGVQLKDYGGIGGLKTINIRSMGTNHVGVFYDGIELGNAQNGVVDLGRFSLDNLESVTLYNGQKSAIFQPAKDFGSAGSIYLQSRTPRFNNEKRYRVRTTFKTGSFGVANPSLLWEQALNDRLSSSLSAEYLYTTGRYSFTYRVKEGYDTTAVRKNGDVQALRLEGGLYGKTNRGSWQAKGYFYRSGRGYPGAVVRNKFSHEDRQWDTNFFVQSSWFQAVSDRYHLQARAKYAYDYLHYLADPRRDESLMYIDNRYRQQEVYASLVQGYTLSPAWEISLATDYQFNTLDANLVDFVYPRRNTVLAALATSLHLHRFRMQASCLATYVTEKVTSGREAAADKFELTPTLVLSYACPGVKGMNLRAFYKRIFRMPTLNDLYYTFIGNVHLDPEYTNQYNFGVTYTRSFLKGWLRFLEAQVDVYYNEVEDKIIATPTSNFFRWTMVNLGNVEIKGIDVSLQSGWQPTRYLSCHLRATYTYQKAQDFTDPQKLYYGGQIPYIPWHSGSAVLNVNLHGWEANYSFLYTGERYASQANIPSNYQLPWYTSDLSLSKALKTGSGQWKLTLEVNNLLNQQYEVVRCYPMPGIHFKAIAQYTF